MPEEKLYYIGVKALIRDEHGQLLVLRIQKPGRAYYDLPGGRIAEGESPIDALRREVREETGIAELRNERLLSMAISPVHIPITPVKSGGLVFAIYACDAEMPASLQPEANMEITWCDEADALEKLSDYPQELLATISRITP